MSKLPKPEKIEKFDFHNEAMKLKDRNNFLYNWSAHKATEDKINELIKAFNWLMKREK